MNAPVPSSIQRLRGSILREVSRSFYLSIRLLPGPLRDPIALAYLLARATDTIADTAEIEVPLRLEKLRTLAALIQGGRPAEASDTFESFAALQNNAAERALLERLPNCLAWLDALPDDDRQDIRAVLSRINEGQTLDVERFPDGKQIVALATSAELDRYTYLVAGCVGEFWTHVCFRHLPRFTSESQGTMLDRGVAYGRGLQLVNILRDLGADMRMGRCYLPAEQLQSVGLTPAELRENAAGAEPVIRAWREKAEQGLVAGAEYACAIAPWRVRFATVLPALLGIRTLALLRDAGPRVFQKKVKMERSEVRRIMFTLTSRLASPATIRALALKLSS